MKKLTTLGLAVVLTFLVGFSAFGGETQSPPCAPGETQSPPCSAAQSASDSTDPGQTSTPPAAASVDVVYVAEAALTALLIF